MAVKIVDFHPLIKLTPLTLLQLRLRQYKYLFLTGSGGVGKSYLIKQFIKARKNTTLVLGSTNLSAVNLGGGTVHRIFKLYNLTNLEQLHARVNDRVEKIQAKNPLTTKAQALEYIYRELVSLLKNVDTIILEEISMLGLQTFELFFYQLAKYGGDRAKQIRVLAVGDFFQLEAVKQELVFQSSIFNHFHVIELQEVKRTTAVNFIDVLQQIRQGNFDDYAIDMLKHFEERYNEADKDWLDDNAIQLFSTNQEVIEHNNKMMDKIKDEDTFSSEYELRYKHPDMNNAAIDMFVKESNFEETLILKKGAKVIFIATDDKQGFYNGLSGTVEGFGRDQEFNPYVIVKTEDKKFRVSTFPFQLLTYEPKGNKRLKVKKLLEVMAVPLKLSYALSIHRSQGMTIRDNLVINCNRIFTFHQFYVAISRCGDPMKLYIKDLDVNKHIRANPRVKRFYKLLRESGRLEKWYGY